MAEGKTEKISPETEVLRQSLAKALQKDWYTPEHWANDPPPWVYRQADLVLSVIHDDGSRILAAEPHLGCRKEEIMERTQSLLSGSPESLKPLAEIVAGSVLAGDNEALQTVIGGLEPAVTNKVVHNGGPEARAISAIAQYALSVMD